MSTQTIALGGVIAVALAGAGVYSAQQNRIEICHATGSEENPWNIITVSVKSWSAHEAHGDKSPVPVGGCDAVEIPPTTPPPPGGTF